MKVLSVRQPWASLIVSGDKDIENRSKPTAYRGLLHIHASQQIDTGAMQDLAAAMIEDGQVLDLLDFPTGVILGGVSLVDCVTKHRSPWFEGPYGWVLARPFKLSRPIAAKGKLGIWEYHR